MITLKCSLNKNIISCDIKQPYILPIGSINKNMLSGDLQGEIDKKVNKDGNKVLSDNNFTNAYKTSIENLPTELDKKVDKVTGKGLIDTGVADNISIKNYGTNDVFTVGAPETDFKYVNAEVINVESAEKIHFGTTDLHAELAKKVDTVKGKGLSSNDYTDTEKAEVAKIKDKVGFTDYATAETAGVVKVVGIKGVKVEENGEIGLNVPSDEVIAQRLSANGNLPITVGNLDYAVRSVRPSVVQNTNTEITLTCAANTIYCLGGDENVTSIALTLPATGQYGDFIQVDFYSDSSSPTNLTITSNAGFTDFTLIPEGDYIYSLFFDWGMAFGDSAWGWRFAYAEYPYVSTAYTEG